MEKIVAAFTHHKISLNDIELSYYRGGQGRALVYLPGGGLGTMAHGGILELLSDYYDVIALDLPGFGDSSPPQSVWALEDYAKIVKLFLAYLQLKDIFLVGVSLGGGIALALAKDSNLVKKMAVIDSAGVTGKQHPWMFRYNFYVKKPLYELIFGMNYRSLGRAVREFFINRRRNSGSWKLIIETLKECLFQEIYGLDKINIPVLILWGKKDELFSVNGATVLQHKLRNSKVVIVDGNHSWPVIRPVECTSLLRGWLG